MRGLGFISGAGVDPAVAGSVSNEMYHVSDWLPTIAGGIAGLSLTNLSKPGQPAPPPLGESGVGGGEGGGAGRMRVDVFSRRARLLRCFTRHGKEVNASS